jgi:hypothetical protein
MIEGTDARSISRVERLEAAIAAEFRRLASRVRPLSRWNSQ